MISDSKSSSFDKETAYLFLLPGVFVSLLSNIDSLITCTLFCFNKRSQDRIKARLRDIGIDVHAVPVCFARVITKGHAPHTMAPETTATTLHHLFRRPPLQRRHLYCRIHCRRAIELDGGRIGFGVEVNFPGVFEDGDSHHKQMSRGDLGVKADVVLRAFPVPGLVGEKVVGRSGSGRLPGPVQPGRVR